MGTGVTTVTSKKARREWKKILDAVQMGQTIIIERRGKPTAVLIPMDDFEKFQEMISEAHAVREAMAAYEEWRHDPSVARSYEDIREELLKPIDDNERT